MHWTTIFAICLLILFALTFGLIQFVIWLDRKQTERIERLVSEAKRRRQAYDWTDAGKYPR